MCVYNFSKNVSILVINNLSGQQFRPCTRSLRRHKEANNILEVPPPALIHFDYSPVAALYICASRKLLSVAVNVFDQRCRVSECVWSYYVAAGVWWNVVDADYYVCAVCMKPSGGWFPTRRRRQQQQQLNLIALAPFTEGWLLRCTPKSSAN